MQDIQDKLTRVFSSRRESFELSPHEHQASDYESDVIELISRLEIDSVCEVLPIASHFNVLDIGAGGGRWTQALAGEVASVTAVEPSSLCELIESRTRRFGNVKCVSQTFEDFELTQQYELAIIYGTLMYLHPDEQAQAFLTKAASAVKEGGYLVLGEAVARRSKYMADWLETPGELFVSELSSIRYWEVLRTEKFYVDVCKANGLSPIAIFESHAPVFGKSRLWPIVRSLGWGTVRSYNKTFRGLYGKLKHSRDMRRMRIMIFNKPACVRSIAQDRSATS